MPCLKTLKVRKKGKKINIKNLNRIFRNTTREICAAWRRGYAWWGSPDDHLPHHYPDRGHWQPHLWFPNYGRPHGG